MKPDNRKFMLNRSSLDTKGNKAAIIFHVLDPDTAEIQKTYELPFELESTLYFLRTTQGFNEVFRITRFQSTIFQVDRVVSQFSKNKVVFNYDIIKNEKPDHLFEDIDFVGEFFEADKVKVIFDSEIKNLADVTEIILLSKPTNEKTFLKAFGLFLVAGSGALLKDQLRPENAEFWQKLNQAIG